MAVIVAPQPQAAEIGLEVLRRGGNAVDAAVTCAFAQGVLDPQMCGIGGCGVMLVHDRHGEDVLLEFYATAGALVRGNMGENLFRREAADRYGYVLDGSVNDVGYQSVGVPGTVAGLATALERCGTIAWDQAIAPAIPLARDGFPVTGFMHGYWTTDYGPDVVRNHLRIQATPAAKELYTKKGELYEVGELLVQGELALTLDRLAKEGPDDARRLVDAMGWAVADREEHLADPRFVEVPTGRLADKEYAAAAARAHDRSDTTHVCVVDDEGGAVSLTHTLGSASGVVTRGLGFGYNDYMNCFDPRPGRPNSIRAGKTRMTMMTPTMVFDGDKLRICVGAPGGTKIVTGILQTIVNVLDHQMTPVEAVSAPRVDFQGDVVQAEARIPMAVTDGLASLGYKVSRRTLNYDSYFSRPQVIVGVDGRAHRQRARPHRRAGDVRGDHPRQPAVQDDRRRLGLGHRHAPEGNVPVRAGGAEAHGRAEVGKDGVPVLDLGAGQPRPDQLLSGEGGAAGHGAHAGDRAGPVQHQRQRGRARLRGDAHDASD